MSDGSEYLRILDPETFRVQRSVPVTFRGAPVQLLNELEWIDGKIWPTSMSPTRSSSSTRQRHRRRVIDLRGLLPDEEIAPDTDVLNGIATTRLGTYLRDRQKMEQTLRNRNHTPIKYHTT